MRTGASLSLFVATAFGLATAPSSADEPKGDLARLQGSWAAKVGPNKDLSATAAIKGNAVEITVVRPEGEDIKLKGEIKVDDAAGPKTLDWVKFIGPQGNELPENHAIYKLEGDSWTVCAGGPGNDRPSKFEAGEGGPPNLTTWTRVKAKEKADEKPIKGELARFQGSWKAEANDVAIGMKVKGNAVTARWERGDNTQVELKGEIRLNDQADPKTIDFFGFKNASGEDLKDNLGIFAVDGEKIKVCVGGPGNERPTEFKAGEGGPPTLLIFARAKE